MAKKKSERYRTMAGEVLEYPRPGPELEAFLERVRAAAKDPRVSEAELVELIYGRENPILDHTVFEDRGAVTLEVFENPVYHLMLDQLDAKRMQAGSLNRDRAEARYTMTVSEAAEALEVSPSAVRQAIASKRLAAWKPGNEYLLDPHSVATYRDHVKRRGPRPAPALRLRMGNKPGASFRVKAPGLERVSKTPLEGGGTLIVATVERFTRAAIAFSGKSVNRMFVLEPAAEANSFEFEGFEVSGRYRVVEKVNDPEEASKRFRSFRTE